MNSKRPFNKFILFLFGAMIVASCLAGLGLYIYRINGSYALDLSRPDYNDQRQEIRHTPDNDRLKVSKDGKVDHGLVEELNKSFEFYLKELNSEPFTERAISDEALGLSAVPAPVE